MLYVFKARLYSHSLARVNMLAYFEQQPLDLQTTLRLLGAAMRKL